MWHMFILDFNEFKSVKLNKSSLENIAKEEKKNIIHFPHFIMMHRTT